VTLIARAATPGLFFDASTKLHDASGRALRSAGYIGCFRYVPLPSVPHGPDIDAPELMTLAQVAGLEVGLIQHTRYPGWQPSQHSGRGDGLVAAEYAAQAEYPDGAHVFLDLEGVDTLSSAAEVIDFCQEWARAVGEYRYKAGLYVGYQQPLSPQQLYDLHGIDSYWSDDGHRKVLTRGCAVQQGPKMTVAGVQIDSDVVASDLLGDRPVVAVWVDS
jgi:hypothetical protein